MTPTQEIASIVRTALSNGETIRVTFKEVNGTTAIDRKITRNLVLIPKDKHPKFVRGENPCAYCIRLGSSYWGGYITAFDVAKGDWIRFYEDSLIAVMDFSKEAEKICS